MLNLKFGFAHTQCESIYSIILGFTLYYFYLLKNKKEVLSSTAKLFCVCKFYVN